MWFDPVEHMEEGRGDQVFVPSAKEHGDKGTTLPIKVQVDNVGAIWLANNSSVSQRTKHVDLRAHFVRDMIKDQVIEINFVKSAENDSDIMTKNQQGQLHVCKI